jgi:hypothetical protein
MNIAAPKGERYVVNSNVYSPVKDESKVSETAVRDEQIQFNRWEYYPGLLWKDSKAIEQSSNQGSWVDSLVFRNYDLLSIPPDPYEVFLLESRINALFEWIENMIKNKLVQFNIEHLFHLKGLLNYLRNHSNKVIAQT